MIIPGPLLAPLTPLYRLALAIREHRLVSGREPIRRLQYPVISIGNLSTGGAGKTPLTIALAQALTARGLAVDVLSRGYGRQSIQPARVDPDGSSDDYGDEPLLIAANISAYVAPQRYDAGLLAESDFAQSTLVGPARPRVPRTPVAAQAELAPPQVVLHLLDDGFQHRQLHRDLDILLLNRADLDDRLLPAGNLREALHAAERAHILAISADDPTLEPDLRARGLTQPIWHLYRRMEVPSVENPVLAFCGIARPEQFFVGLRHSAVDLAACKAFPDHYRYTAHDLDRLAKIAHAKGATSFLTTEKDAVRLRGLESPLPLATVSIRTEIENASAALDWLLDRLSSTHSYR